MKSSRDRKVKPLIQLVSDISRSHDVHSLNLWSYSETYFLDYGEEEKGFLQGDDGAAPTSECRPQMFWI